MVHENNPGKNTVKYHTDQHCVASHHQRRSQRNDCQSTVSTLQQTLQEAVVIAANQVSAEMKAQMNLVKEFAYNSVLWGDIDRDSKIDQLHSLRDNSGFDHIIMTDASGISLETRENMSGLEASQHAKTTGSPFISDPVRSDGSEDMLILFAVPVMRNNVFQGARIAGKSASFLSDLVSTIHVGTGNAAVLNKSGDTIGFADYNLVLQKYNTQKEAKSDSKLECLAAIEYSMTQGNTGFADYYYAGQEKMMAYAPVPGTNGWSIDIAIVQSDFMGVTRQSLFTTAFIMLAALIAAVALAIRLSSSIANPIKATAERLRKLAEGDLKSDVSISANKDETGLLSNSLSQTVLDLRDIITDITLQLGELSQGNFCIDFHKNYKVISSPYRIPPPTSPNPLTIPCFKSVRRRTRWPAAQTRFPAAPRHYHREPPSRPAP